MIEVEHLSKRFGATLAVDDLSFRVERGEVVGFLGPNGAGKTTTIRVLAGYHSATSGAVRVAGHDVLTEPVEVRRNVGYLPENVPLYGDMRVVEYLRYRAELKGVAAGERKAAVERAMERCGVVEVRRKLVRHVSRGYRQRVGLADALVASPSVLILDEPTSGLDPNQRRRIKELVRELAEEHTILFSSHILAEVGEVSDRILLIDRGRLQADGTIEQLLAQAGGRRLRVEARAPAEELVALLGDLDGCEPFQVVGDDGAFGLVEAAVDPAADPREACARLLHDRGLLVRALALQMPTLEGYFAEVTEGAVDHSAGGAA